jgi:type IV pilus assembly protein PilA
MNKVTRKVQQGFTLIELMIVVAIVGILAAIAIPAYQDFLIRSKVSEATAALGACKTNVAEYHATKGSNLPANLAQSGCSSIASQYMASLNVAAGVITATITGTHGGSDPDSKTLVLSPLQDASSNLTGWTCTTTALAKYVPASCRG